MACFSPILLVDPRSLNMAESMYSFVVGMTVMIVLPLFILSFSLFAFCRYLFYRLRLDNPESHEKEFHLRKACYEEMEAELADTAGQS